MKNKTPLQRAYEKMKGKFPVSARGYFIFEGEEICYTEWCYHAQALRNETYKWIMS